MPEISETVSKLEGEISILKEGAATRTAQIVSLMDAVLRIDAKAERLDGDIRCNGKEGLSSIARRTEEKLDALLGTIEKMIEKQVGNAIEKLNLEITGKFNTNKMRAITREEIKTYNKETEPGSWQEFRKTWLFPIVMMIISAIMSAGLTYIIVSKP